MGTVQYCELQAQRRDSTGWLHALMVLYNNVRCLIQLQTIEIHLSTNVVDRVGPDCSCFDVNDVRFCARTHEEKNLWLRAITNVKVKMSNAVSEPDSLEL